MLSHQLRYAATQEQMFLREKAVWITVQVAESAARSNGRTRPGNWLPTTGDGPRRQETIGAATESRFSSLTQISGNPRDACLRFLRRLGVAEKRSYREWTTRERQRLIELIDNVPVEEAARVLRRPPASVRSMLHRLGLGVRQSR